MLLFEVFLESWVLHPMIFSAPVLKISPKDGSGSRDCRLKVLLIGVIFGCFGRNIDGDSWFTWWFSHLPGPSIYPKRTPMVVHVTCG